MENWITIITFDKQHEAYLAANFLESENLEVNIKDDLTAQVHNFYASAIGGIKVQVKESQMENAITLLRGSGYIVEDSAKTVKLEVVQKSLHPDKTTCPFCSSKNMGKRKDPNILAIAIYFFLGIFFPIFRQSYICYDCNTNWIYKNK